MGSLIARMPRNPISLFLARRRRRRRLGIRRLPAFSQQSIIYLLLHLIIFIVGIALTRLPNVIAQGVGVSVIAVGVSGWMLYLVVRLNEREQARRDASDGLGLVAAFETRSIPIKREYETRLANARHNIDIMGFGLSHLREEFLDQLPDWYNNAELRILLVDPKAPSETSSFADLRDLEEHQKPGTISADVDQFLDETLALRRESADRFQIRLCTAIPSINLFRIDYEAFWGPYLVASSDKERRSRNLPTFIVDHRGFLFTRLCEHFDTIWSSNEFSRRPTDETW